MEKRPRCHICRVNHPLQYCKPFRVLSVGLRWKSARVKGFCLNCLEYNHFRKECPSTKRCAALVNGQPCNAFHHTLLHPEPTEKDVLAAPHREKTVNSQLEDIRLVDELHLEDTPSTVKKEFLNAATNTPTHHKRISVSQGTQTLPRANHHKFSTPVRKIVATQTPIMAAWPIQPIVRVNLNFKGAKMFTEFLLDRKAENSYILWDVVKILPEFRPIRLNGQIFGRFRLEPSFPHTEQDSFVMDLPIKERLDVNMPDPILDASLLQHFKQYEPLAHPFFDTWREVDGVLGSDVARKILKPDIEQSSLDLPISQLSTFGWIVSGVWRGCSCHSQGGSMLKRLQLYFYFVFFL
ncbi:uncharacterized protein LOC124419552 [Lucilia cuprina]|uniref:uncharacterized protein LOC124419552 n=1 Tax=Lucilia cuprina TaxID=7375 RepID=UPI001F064802|nr:uncharacterized protein LOC124419552 [Lucilia cuprina]